MLITGKQEKVLLEQAKREHWALGAFNAFDTYTMEAIMQAAEELKVPAMMQIWDFYNPANPEKSFMPEFPAKVLLKTVMMRAEMSPVPGIIHLDHTPSFEGCVRGIRNGASSVMIDASKKPLEENIALTAKVVEAAHACGVLVEGEIGHVDSAGVEDGAIYTEVEPAKEYVSKSGIDLCAVSIGTAHGYYATEPVLNYDRIAELYEALPVPLVMHGSSGLNEEQFRESIRAGIVKINFATYVQVMGGKAIAEAAANAVPRPMFNKLADAGLKAAKEYIQYHMELFGTRPVSL